MYLNIKPLKAVMHKKSSFFPVNGQWSEWEGFSHCTKSCGTGTQVKKRFCNNPAPSGGGKECLGPSSETRNCNTNTCAGMNVV